MAEKKTIPFLSLSPPSPTRNKFEQVLPSSDYWPFLFNEFIEHMDKVDEAENEARMSRGELYHAFLPQITAKRNRCHHACHRFNRAGDASRRKLVQLWRE
jgi:hypothetical protein